MLSRAGGANTDHQSAADASMNERSKNRAKKAVLDIGALVLLIVLFVIAARLVGSDTSMLPWNW